MTRIPLALVRHVRSFTHPVTDSQLTTADAELTLLVDIPAIEVRTPTSTRCYPLSQIAHYDPQAPDAPSSTGPVPAGEASSPPAGASPPSRRRSKP